MYRGAEKTYGCAVKALIFTPCFKTFGF